MGFDYDRAARAAGQSKFPFRAMLGLAVDGLVNHSLLPLRLASTVSLLAGLFTELKAVREDGETLLDRTMILYGSNLGNASTHVTTNLPTLFAGGGFQHGQHLAFDRARNYPLPNLFVSVLQRLGIEAASFGPSTGTMRGLEVA